MQRISLAVKSPEDLIRQKEALIDTLPVTPAPTKPDAVSYRADWRARVLAEGSEEARLRVEIIDTVEDLRSQASGPEESIRLIDEFRDLNRETLEGLRKASKPPRDAAPSPTVPLDRPSEENRLRLDILSALSEIEGHAKSPEELIHLKAEFLRLNKETLQELLSDSIDSNKKGQ